MIHLLIGHIEIKTLAAQFKQEHSDPLTISGLYKVVIF
jgi:hypothetical protein